MIWLFNYSQILILWFIDLMIWWLSDSMNQWSNDSLIQWINDSMIWWFSDSTLWRFDGSMMLWFDDMTIQWFNDSSIERLNDSINGCPTCCLAWAPPIEEELPWAACKTHLFPHCTPRASLVVSRQRFICPHCLSFSNSIFHRITESTPKVGKDPQGHPVQPRTHHQQLHPPPPRAAPCSPPFETTELC